MSWNARTHCNCRVLGLPGQELATRESKRMLFSQRTCWLRTAPRPIGGICLEDVGLCGVSNLQDWCTREVILTPLESTSWPSTPVHLVGLTLSGEIRQECCNCCKTGNESVIVANKTQESPDVGLRYRSGVLPSTLHFARIWLDDPPPMMCPR